MGEVSASQTSALDQSLIIGVFLRRPVKTFFWRPSRTFSGQFYIIPQDAMNEYRTLIRQFASSLQGVNRYDSDILTKLGICALQVDKISL